MARRIPIPIVWGQGEKVAEMGTLASIQSHRTQFVGQVRNDCAVAFKQKRGVYDRKQQQHHQLERAAACFQALGQAASGKLSADHSDRIYNDRNIAGTLTKSAHAEGRALDVHLRANHPDQRSLGDQRFRALVRKASFLGIDNVIWNREIWNREIWNRARGGPRLYNGKNPHTDHIHVEFTRAGSQSRALSEIEIDIAIIRAGIEDLRKGRDHIAWAQNKLIGDVHLCAIPMGPLFWVDETT